MPTVGSQITICDLPVRFDTYEGCSHQCSYCFVLRKNDLKVGAGESADTLKKWVQGQRTKELSWCDWEIPLHWGGVSDPFQPIEKKEKRSLKALEVFAESQYPFVVSTKNALISQEPYLTLIKKCNCVVQFSAVCPKYDAMERGASTYEQRLEAMRKIAPHKRVIVRVQPYTPEVLLDVMQQIRVWADIGVYGIVVEGMKYVGRRKGVKLVSIGADLCYPVELLKAHFEKIKASCHKNGLRFFCGENRLRFMGDSLCCCGIEGMGWQENKANLNHIIYDKEGVHYTQGQCTKPIHRIGQATLLGHYTTSSTYKEVMELAARSSKVNELKPIK